MKTPITTLGMLEGEVDEKFESKKQRNLGVKCERSKIKCVKWPKSFLTTLKIDSLPEKVDEGKMLEGP